MWKLCKADGKVDYGILYSQWAEELQDDFQHEGVAGNRLGTGKLAGISTSPKRLLLLLVL
jgi:hypothetical protein